MPYNPAGDAEDFKFIMLCIKYSDAKLQPDHDMVAKEMGIEKKGTSAGRFNAIMRKWGPAGQKRATNGMKVTKPGNKRKRESKEAADDRSGIKGEGSGDEANGQEQRANVVVTEESNPEKKLKIEVTAEDESDA